MIYELIFVNTRYTLIIGYILLIRPTKFYTLKTMIQLKLDNRTLFLSNIRLKIARSTVIQNYMHTSIIMHYEY